MHTYKVLNLIKQLALGRPDYKIAKIVHNYCMMILREFHFCQLFYHECLFHLAEIDIFFPAGMLVF